MKPPKPSLPERRNRPAVLERTLGFRIGIRPAAGAMRNVPQFHLAVACCRRMVNWKNCWSNERTSRTSALRTPRNWSPFSTGSQSRASQGRRQLV